MFSLSARGVRKILCLGAHSDDIEIGCGGSILSVLSHQNDLDITWVVFSGDETRQREARLSAESFLEGASSSRIITKNFSDTRFPYEGEALKAYFSELKSEVDPDLVLTHYRHDLHQDHRTLSELTWNAFRGHWILEYEIPKFDGDLGIPNLFIPVDVEVAKRKAALIWEHFRTQRGKHWFDEETLLSLMRIRGMETGGESRYAEAYHSRKTVLVGLG